MRYAVSFSSALVGRRRRRAQRGPPRNGTWPGRYRLASDRTHPISRFAVQHPVLVTSGRKASSDATARMPHEEIRPLLVVEDGYRWHRVQPRRYVCLLESLRPQTWVAPLREALSSPTEILARALADDPVQQRPLVLRAGIPLRS